MEAFLQNHRTTPDKRSKLALYYKLKIDLLVEESRETALDCYMKSAMEYMKLSLQSKAFEPLSVARLREGRNYDRFADNYAKRGGWTPKLSKINNPFQTAYTTYKWRY
ncbi:Fe-S oxidoreductase [Paenibacillus popilliae ATCC 14706]|uniref:Fe-S oxidoreductase n=1 Tax=Paenibacillus popilliae ATCC 14706 TaxID=1212764 RepID=M9L8G1_PAEPP|nr:Fe-S oxidoreductase [Paenibacillus popilliae ATCC 14706]